MSSSSAVLRVTGLSAEWDRTPVLSAVTFEVRDRELLVLMGPNGSGKTTLLRCLAGLEPITAGSVELDGREVSGRPTHRRGIGLMFQDPALFPHRTVAENIAYAPLLQRRPRADVEAEVGRMAELLHLEGFEDRYPDQLSGGERQRVALARTLAARPRLVLLDEPFASIDVELKAELRAEFRSVLRALGTTAIHVTHDREEGLFLGDRVALLFGGRLGEPQSPEVAFRSPRDERAARFLGYNVVGSDGGAIAVHPDDVRVEPPRPGLRTGELLAAGSTGRGLLRVVRLDTGERIEVRGASPDDAGRADLRVGVSWERSIPLYDRTDRALPKSP